MALQAGSRLRALSHSPGLFLILQHVSMSPPVPVVNRKGIASEHAGEPRTCSRLFGRQRFGTAEARLSDVRSALVALEFPRPVYAPSRRIRCVLIHLHQPDIGILRLLLSLEDRGH